MPKVVKVEVTPTNVDLGPGESQVFTAVADLDDGTKADTLHTFAATGGSMNTDGLFTAGAIPGTFPVIALTSDGPTDTAYVSIAYPPPDILSSESFENGWGGFQNNSGGTPDPPAGPATITRSQEQVHSGAWSARTTFSDNRPFSQAVAFTYTFGSRANVYVRVYFYATNLPDDSHKWIRFQTPPGFSGVKGGLYTDGPAGFIAWRFSNSTPGNIGTPIGVGVPTLNAWHSIEINYDNANGRVRFWYDGVPVVGTPAGNNYWQDGWLYSGGGPSANPHMVVFDDTINDGNTQSGAIYYDDIAISTRRIGP